MILDHYTDVDWLRLAFKAAAEHSDDPDTQNGAVLAPQTGFVAVAANCLPAGVTASPWRLERPMKYRYIEHAERAAIYAAASQGTKTAGAVLYCCWFACPDCARGIICAGIREVVGHVGIRQRTPERWETQVRAGERLLKSAGVGLRWLSGEMGVRIRFDGEDVEC